MDLRKIVGSQMASAEKAAQAASVVALALEDRNRLAALERVRVRAEVDALVQEAVEILTENHVVQHVIVTGHPIGGGPYVSGLSWVFHGVPFWVLRLDGVGEIGLGQGRELHRISRSSLPTDYPASTVLPLLTEAPATVIDSSVAELRAELRRRGLLVYHGAFYSPWSVPVLEIGRETVTGFRRLAPFEDRLGAAVAQAVAMNRTGA